MLSIGTRNGSAGLVESLLRVTHTCSSDQFHSVWCDGPTHHGLIHCIVSLGVAIVCRFLGLLDPLAFRQDSSTSSMLNCMHVIRMGTLATRHVVPMRLPAFGVGCTSHGPRAKVLSVHASVLEDFACQATAPNDSLLYFIMRCLLRKLIGL